MAFDKNIREKGIVISKTHNEAREARTDFNGTQWPAKEEEFLIEVISCDEEDFDKEFGIAKGTRCSYKVDKATFDKVKFGMWANVKYTMKQFGEKTTFVPVSFALVENK